MSDQVHNYAVLGFIVRHGNSAAAALCVSSLAVFLTLFAFYTMPAWTLAVAVGALGVLYGLLRSYVEIVQVISETLLPR